MSGENEEIDVFVGRASDHRKSPVGYDLGAVNDYLCSVLVSHLCDAVNVRDIACYVGSGRDCYVLDLVLLEHLFDLVILDASLIINIGVDDLAAVAPGKIVRVMLHAGCEDDVFLARNECGSELVEAVSRAVYIYASVIRVRAVYEA